jgi:hypothetical protein
LANAFNELILFALYAVFARDISLTKIESRQDMILHYIDGKKQAVMLRLACL